MSERSTKHASFTVVRNYDATPEQVFAAWSDPAAKAAWFGPSEKSADSYSLDFRVGGREHLTVPTPAGTYAFDATYQDIVDGERLIYSYDMHLDGARISVSLTTVQIEARGTRAQLTFVEQGVFLDGLDEPAPREHGSNELMDKLGEYVEGGMG